MAKTKNKYSYPSERFEKMTYTESPAHVGPLKHAVDFIVTEGTSVKAADDGVVVDVKDDSDSGSTEKRSEGWGNYIEIKHAHGEYSEYEHLKKDSARVKIGDKIKRGQIIAESGATGWIAHLGPHLHFMVGKYGKTPKNYQTLQVVWISSR